MTQPFNILALTRLWRSPP